MARVLIVDDEKGIRDALAQVFEYEGQEVRVAEDGPDAVSYTHLTLPTKA